ncbi:hypothetical protein BJV74DRAFT_799694 [Russula compacta]|nr:hypothetical protein BJV74DRAFT_799694 [Russula compacta]
MSTCLPLLSYLCLLTSTCLYMPVPAHAYSPSPHLPCSNPLPSASLTFRDEKCAFKQPKNKLSSRNIVYEGNLNMLPSLMPALLLNNALPMNPQCPLIVSALLFTPGLWPSGRDFNFSMDHLAEMEL